MYTLFSFLSQDGLLAEAILHHLTWNKGLCYSRDENEALTFRICITINDFRIDVISDVFRMWL